MRQVEIHQWAYSTERVGWVTELVVVTRCRVVSNMFLTVQAAQRLYLVQALEIVADAAAVVRHVLSMLKTKKYI
jgi:hypothetical protein